MGVKISFDSIQKKQKLFKIKIFLLLINGSDLVQIWRVFGQFKTPLVEYLKHNFVVFLINIPDKRVLEQSDFLCSHSATPDFCVFEVLEVLKGLKSRDVVEFVFQRLCQRIVCKSKFLKLSFLTKPADFLVLIETLQKTVFETSFIVFSVFLINKVLHFETAFSAVACLRVCREVHFFTANHALLSSWFHIRSRKNACAI